MLEVFIRALEGNGSRISRSGSGRVAQCPAHEDGRPSLSVSMGDKGVVFKCHAGCEKDDILAALDLTWGDVFKKDGEDRRRSGGRDDWMPCQGFKDTPAEDRCPGHKAAEYRYTDEAGKLLFAACRCSRKKDGCKRPFAQWQPDGKAPHGKRWDLRDVRRVMYRLPEVLAAVKDGRRIWITEGEKDADLLASMGEVATSSPMGAGSWLKEYAKYFRDAAEVIIVVDCDDPGLKHAEQVFRDVSKFATKVKVVYTPVNEKGADTSDHFEYGLGLDDFERAFFEEIEPRPHMVIQVEKEHREKPVVFAGFGEEAIERSLVGSMLRFGTGYQLAESDIATHDRLRIAVRAIARLDARQIAILPETVAEEIANMKSGKFETALRFLEELEGVAFSDIEKPRKAARIVRERSLRREITYLCRAIEEAARDERRTIEEVLASLRQMSDGKAQEFARFDEYCPPVGDVFTGDVVAEVQQENEIKNNVRELRPVVSDKEIEEALDDAGDGAAGGTGAGIRSADLSGDQRSHGRQDAAGVRRGSQSARAGRAGLGVVPEAR